MPVELDALWRVIELVPATPGNLRTHGTDRHTAAGEILVAVDEEGERALLFPAGAEESFAPDASTKVHLRKRLLRWTGGEDEFVAVTCRVERLKPVFTTLAEDMLEAAVGSERPGAVLRRVLDEWRDLLSAENPAILPRHKIVGLTAELLTLRDVLQHDPVRNLGVWAGPDEALHDLRSDKRAIEVKGSLAREDLHVQIHGLRQLEPPSGGTLHLVLHRLEEDSGGALALPDLVREILDLGVNRHAFIDLLRQTGYEIADEAEYALRRFTLFERRVYRIDNTFPRIVPTSFAAGAAPAGVLLVRYAVDLTGPSPVPIPAQEADHIIATFASGG